MLKIRSVSRIDAGRIFAVAPDGQRVAVASEGLLLIDISSGADHRIATEYPTALGWSPDGRLLGAAFPTGQETKLNLFDPAGAIAAETWVPGRVAGIFVISGNEVLVAVTKLKTFGFGTSCQEIFYRWRIGEEPAPQILHETTLKPLTMRNWSAESLSQAMQPVLSPLGDELLYGRIMDPPAFAPYLKFVIRNLRQNTEREIATAGLEATKPVFTADGEEILLGNGTGKTGLFAAWSGEERSTFPRPGRIKAISPTARHVFIDGHLYRSGSEIAVFPTPSDAAFLADGSLMLAWEGTLYLVEGIESVPLVPPMDAERTERLRTIRAWRAGDLITPAEYGAAKERVLHR